MAYYSAAMRQNQGKLAPRPRPSSMMTELAYAQLPSASDLSNE